MKPFPVLTALLLFASSCQGQDAAQVQQAQSLPPIEVYFSPKGGCTEAVVKELTAAKATILVQAYSFASAPIAKALVDAHSGCPNHTAAFWNDVDKVMPDYQERKEWLRGHGVGVDL